MRTHQKQLIKAWIAAGLWIGLITIESTSLLSSDNTSRLLYPVFRFLFGLGLSEFEPLHAFLRKAGHFVGYFTLSFFLFRAWKVTLPLSRAWAMRWSVIAFSMSVLVASLDEWHQTFLPSRTGRFADVVLDGSAALTAQILIFLFLNRKADAMSAAEG